MCVSVCVRACVRVCVCARARVFVCMCVCMCARCAVLMLLFRLTVSQCSDHYSHVPQDIHFVGLPVIAIDHRLKIVMVSHPEPFSR